MIVGQEYEELGDSVRLLNHINTDEAERENWHQVQEAGKGFIRDGKGQVIGREIARIPVDEAAMLESQRDLDYLAYSLCDDRNALRRLLLRFPHWRVCEGGI